MKDNRINAGAAIVDITPPIGFRMQGILRRIEPSVGVHKPLRASALVISNTNYKIAIIDCDLIGFDLPLVNTIRRKIAKKIGTNHSHVTVACTHTHNGPATITNSLGGPHDILPRPGEIEKLDLYISNLVNKLVEVAAEANKALKPARVGSGIGQSQVNINREQLMSDGRIFVGRNHEGITDHSVDVLRVDNLEGKPIAIICCFAAHPVVMGMDSLLLGPDYPGVVREVIEQNVGGTCLFLTGAAGNQATLEFLQDDWNEVDRIGKVIGLEAAKIATSIDTRPHEVIMKTTSSMANVALYNKQFSDRPIHNSLMVHSRTVTVPLQKLPSLPEAETLVENAEKSFSHAEHQGATERDLVPLLIMRRWTKGVLKKVSKGIRQDKLVFDIIGYKIDDFALVVMPGEPFVEIALGIKEWADKTHIMVSGYGNGNVGYLPSADTVAQGGMAVEAAVKTYNLSAPPVSETVEIVVAECRKLLNDLGVKPKLHQNQ